MLDYSKLTNEIFSEVLEEIVDKKTGSEILSIPGIAADLAEELNNEVLAEWAEGNPDDSGWGRMKLQTKVRISDTVIGETYWPVWSLSWAWSADLTCYVVVAQCVVSPGVYSQEFVGMTAKSLSDWTKYDGAEVHPEKFQEVECDSVWEAFADEDFIVEIIEEVEGG